MQYDNIQDLHLTPSESTVMNFILANKQALTYMSVRDIASQCHVAPSTVIRLVKKMSFSSFAELKHSILEDQKRLGLKEADIYKGLADVISPEIFPANFNEKIKHTAQFILKDSPLYCVGLGSSGIIAKYAHRTFSILGCFTYYTNEVYSPILLSDTKRTGVVLMFSVSGETRELIDFSARIAQTPLSLITITNGSNNTLTSYADYSIPYYSKNYSVSDGVDFTSQLPAMFIVESIAQQMYLLKK